MANKQVTTLKKLVRRFEALLKAQETAHSKLVNSIEAALDEADAAIAAVDGDTSPPGKVQKTSKVKPDAAKPSAKKPSAKKKAGSLPPKKTVKKKKVAKQTTSIPVEED